MIVIIMMHYSYIILLVYIHHLMFLVNFQLIVFSWFLKNKSIIQIIMTLMEN